VVELNKPEIEEMSFKIPFDEKTVIYDERLGIFYYADNEEYFYLWK